MLRGVDKRMRGTATPFPLLVIIRMTNLPFLVITKEGVARSQFALIYLCLLCVNRPQVKPTKLTLINPCYEYGKDWHLSPFDAIGIGCYRLLNYTQKRPLEDRATKSQWLPASLHACSKQL